MEHGSQLPTPQLKGILKAKSLTKNNPPLPPHTTPPKPPFVTQEDFPKQRRDIVHEIWAQLLKEKGGILHRQHQYQPVSEDTTATEAETSSSLYRYNWCSLDLK